MDGRTEQTRPIGGTGTGDGVGATAEGERPTGAGHAPAAGTLSGIPAARQSSPDVIRTILSGAAGSGPIVGSSGAATVVDEGAVHLQGLEDALPQVVARAQHTRLPFTLLLARPGPSSQGRSATPASAGEVEDLAASLSVSLSPVQDLFSAGPGHLGVVIPGRTGAGQREAMRLTRRAAAEGAPLFTWAAARYPRDATTAAGLIEVASNRLDGRLVSRIDDAAARTPERGTGRYGAAIWAGVGAAVLLGAIVFALHGANAPGTKSATGTLIQSQQGDGSGSGSQQPGGSSGSGTSGSAGGSYGGGSYYSTSGAPASGQSGVPAAGPAPGGSSGSGATSGGTGGATSGSGGTSGTGTQSSGSTGTSSGSGSGLPAGNGGSVLGGGTGTLGGGTGTTGTGTGTGTGTPTTTTTVPSTTTTTVPATTTTTSCTGLIQGLTCTVNGIVGGLNP